MNKHLINAAALAALALVASSCSSDDGPRPAPSLEISRSETATVEAHTDFAFDVLRQCIADGLETHDNILIAPYSLSVALSMAANGAEEGEALSEYTSRLMSGSDNLGDLNNLNAKLLNGLPSLDSKVELAMANSIWTRTDCPFIDTFSKNMAEYYSATCDNADLYTQAGIDKLNNWVSDKTAGSIKNFMEMPDEIMSMLVSVCSFQGKWQTVFKKDDTKIQDFTNSQGVAQKVKMMSNHTSYRTYKDNNLGIVRMPYGDGAFRMTAILPAKGKTIAETAELLSSRSWNNDYASDNTPVSLIKFPRFKVSASRDMRPVIAKTGLSYALSDDCTDYTAMCTLPPLVSYLSIDRIQHAVNIEVDEEGTTAQAASGNEFVGYITGNDGYSLIFNRPFIFIIDEVSTGEILFAGVINDISLTSSY